VKSTFDFIKQNGMAHARFVQNCDSVLYRIFIVTLVHAALLSSRVFGIVDKKFYRKRTCSRFEVLT